jgi:hypothetical protein
MLTWSVLGLDTAGVQVPWYFRCPISLELYAGPDDSVDGADLRPHQHQVVGGHGEHHLPTAPSPARRSWITPCASSSRSAASSTSPCSSSPPTRTSSAPSSRRACAAHSTQAHYGHTGDQVRARQARVCFGVRAGGGRDGARACGAQQG